MYAMLMKQVLFSNKGYENFKKLFVGLRKKRGEIEPNQKAR